MLTMLPLLLAAGSAHAADTQPFVLTADADALPVTDIDSGWWPEEGPVRVRTVLFAEGIASIDIEGDSIIETDANGSTHRLDHTQTESEAGITLFVDASLYLSLDVAGYTWEDMLHEQTVEFDVSQTFESFAFSEDGGLDLDLPMNTEQVFEIDQGILPLVDVVISGSLSPDAALTIQTEAIETDNGTFTTDDQSMTAAGGPMQLEALGTLTSLLEMSVQGHAEVCITWVDCYGDFNYDFSIDPIEHTQELIYEAITVDHAQTTGGDNGDNPGSDDAADGPNDADSQDAPSASGGCSTAPRSPSLGMWVILLMGALCVRRKST